MRSHRPYEPSLSDESPFIQEELAELERQDVSTPVLRPRPPSTAPSGILDLLRPLLPRLSKRVRRDLERAAVLQAMDRGVSDPDALTALVLGARRARRGQGGSLPRTGGEWEHVRNRIVVPLQRTLAVTSHPETEDDEGNVEREHDCLSCRESIDPNASATSENDDDGRYFEGENDELEDDELDDDELENDELENDELEDDEVEDDELEDDEDDESDRDELEDDEDDQDELTRLRNEELFEHQAHEQRSRTGQTLPYQDATDLVDCVRTMGTENADYCRRLVQGAPAPVPRHYSLDVTAPDVQIITTTSGKFYRFPAASGRRNFERRPQFKHPSSAMEVYTGPGSNGTARIHPAVREPLRRLMTALRAEGDAIGDQSLKQAVVQNGYRGPTYEEGVLYRDALLKTIHDNAAIFGHLTLSSELRTLATSELGFTGSPAHRQFEAAIAHSPQWNADLARQLVAITAEVKAPRGGSAHHSGLALDIDFPYALSNGTITWHHEQRERNTGALRSAAGVWLQKYASDFGFDSYNTSKEIWHQEWRNWAGSSADPTPSNST